MNDLSAICIGIPSTIFMLYLLIRGMHTYKANGLSLWLLFLLFLATALNIVTIFVFVYTKNLIEANDSDLLLAS